MEVVSIKECLDGRSGQLIITGLFSVAWGFATPVQRSFRGTGTVWYTWPEAVRASAREERELARIERQFHWGLHQDKATIYDPEQPLETV